MPRFDVSTDTYFSCQYCGSTVTSFKAEQHDKWHKALALLIFCPACKAAPGEPCVDKLTATYLHDARVMLR